MYSTDFEELFLADTQVLYEAEGRRLVVEANMPVPDYLTHVDRRLKQEQDRLAVSLLIAPSAWPNEECSVLSTLYSLVSSVSQLRLPSSCQERE